MEVLPIEDHREDTGESWGEPGKELVTISFEDDLIQTIHVGSQLIADHRDQLMIFLQANEDIFV